MIEIIGTEDEARAKDRDHRIVRINGKFAGFVGLGKTNICLERCPECDRENYAMNVIAGICTWCGFNANATEAAENHLSGNPG